MSHFALSVSQPCIQEDPYSNGKKVLRLGQTQKAFLENICKKRDENKIR